METANTSKNLGVLKKVYKHIFLILISIIIMSVFLDYKSKKKNYFEVLTVLENIEFNTSNISSFINQYKVKFGAYPKVYNIDMIDITSYSNADIENTYYHFIDPFSINNESFKYILITDTLNNDIGFLLLSRGADGSFNTNVYSVNKTKITNIKAYNSDKYINYEFSYLDYYLGDKDLIVAFSIKQ